MEAKLCLIDRDLMGNPSGVLLAARLTRVSGQVDRLAAPDMIEAFTNRPHGITLGVDKGSDAPISLRSRGP